MNYETGAALRDALEHRLGEYSNERNVSTDRLRRRVVFERTVVRLDSAEPGAWVVKGGMALEVRLRDQARLTKDLDLGLRDADIDGEILQERLLDALTTDPDEDRFSLTVSVPKRCSEDGDGQPTWRATVTAALGGRTFGQIRLDISPRAHELEATDKVALPTALQFAGIEAHEIEIIDVHRHAAEKLHAMQKDFGERENSRVRDLVDVVLLVEHDLLDPGKLDSALVTVWAEREAAAPPDDLPELSPGWPERYESTAAELELQTLSFDEATAVVRSLWKEAKIAQGSSG